MKKKLLLTSVASLALASAFVLSSCGSNVNVEKYESYSEKNLLNTDDEITAAKLEIETFYSEVFLKNAFTEDELLKSYSYSYNSIELDDDQEDGKKSYDKKEESSIYEYDSNNKTCTQKIYSYADTNTNSKKANTKTAYEYLYQEDDEDSYRVNLLRNTYDEYYYSVEKQAKQAIKELYYDFDLYSVRYVDEDLVKFYYEKSDDKLVLTAVINDEKKENNETVKSSYSVEYVRQVVLTSTMFKFVSIDNSSASASYSDSKYKEESVDSMSMVYEIKDVTIDKVDLANYSQFDFGK